MLVYTSEPLDRDLEVIGPVEMVLYAASSARDTDFIVRLCDVYPDGRSIFLTEGIIRARYRDSVEGDSVELLEPGEVAEYRIRCYPVANVFRQGHRVRVDVTSSSFPRFSRNLNTGEDVGTGTRMQVAHQTVLHTAAYPSHVRAARHPVVIPERRFPTYEAEERLRAMRSADVEPVPLHGTSAPALPDHVVQAVAAALGGPMRTPPARGLEALRELLAGELERTTGRSVDPESEILVTNGAMQALGVCFQSLLEPGDEVVVPAPCFFFEGPIRAAGGVPVYVTGSAADGWRWDAGADRAGAGRTDACPAPLQSRQPDRIRARPGRRRRRRAGGRGARRRRRHGRGLRGVALGGSDAHVRVRPRRGRDRDPQPRQEPLAAPAPRRLLAAPPPASSDCARVLEWDCLRVGLASQEAALAVLAGPRDWLAAIHAHVVAARAVALAAVAATPGLVTVTPRAAPFLFVGAASGAATSPSTDRRRAARRRRPPLPGPGLRTTPVRWCRRGASRARAGARPLGRHADAVDAPSHARGARWR